MIALSASATLFILSSFPLQGADLAGGMDKAAHLAAYFMLGGSYLMAAGGGPAGLTPARIALAWAAALLFGISDEWHQSFVPGRMAELGDIIADGAGAGLAAGLAWVVMVRGRRQG